MYSYCNVLVTTSKSHDASGHSLVATEDFAVTTDAQGMEGGSNIFYRCLYRIWFWFVSR